MDWIKDRMPTEEEQEQSDIGFIICVSGRDTGDNELDHAIYMGVFYEDGKWYTDDGWLDSETHPLTVHGWMLPPRWEEER